MVTKSGTNGLHGALVFWNTNTSPERAVVLLQAVHQQSGHRTGHPRQDPRHRSLYLVQPLSGNDWRSAGDPQGLQRPQPHLLAVRRRLLLHAVFHQRTLHRAHRQAADRRFLRPAGAGKPVSDLRSVLGRSHARRSRRAHAAGRKYHPGQPAEPGGAEAAALLAAAQHHRNQQRPEQLHRRAQQLHRHGPALRPRRPGDHRQQPRVRLLQPVLPVRAPEHHLRKAVGRRVLHRRHPGQLPPGRDRRRSVSLRRPTGCCTSATGWFDSSRTSRPPARATTSNSSGCRPT